MPSKGEIATIVIKNTLGSTGGVIGVTNDNEEVKKESSKIREYRYSGTEVNNYIYYNCKEGEEQSAGNCEVWRIIGVFKDEEGSEYLKIVKNNVLTSDMFPATFSANGTIYKIQYSTGLDSVYWNNIKGNINGTTTDKNDWATGGLQYWLNTGFDKETKKTEDGYMSYLSKNAKDMIKNTKYYLGMIDSGISGDNARSAYTHERAVESCNNNIGSTITTGCRVWSGNKATWMGYIALLYPSDYGFSVNSSYWKTNLYNYNSSAKNTSWLQQSNHNDEEWLLSSSSDSSYRVISWMKDGNLYMYNIFSINETRPCLYLKSDVRILEDTTGEENNPYQLVI